MSSDSRIFQATLSNFDQMMEWVRVTIDQYGNSTTESRKFELVLEEALVNIIHYAYPSISGLVEIGYRFNADENSLVFVLKDEGVPFNPLSVKRKAKQQVSLDETKEGGLGIYFMQQISDHVEYKREKDSNILSITKGMQKTG